MSAEFTSQPKSNKRFLWRSSGPDLTSNEHGEIGQKTKVTTKCTDN